MARLRGAVTVIVGIQPEVAFTMVRLGVGPGNVPTALDLEEGLQMLADQVPSAPVRAERARSEAGTEGRAEDQG
jgi:rsbT antagonist protein RsbS